MGINFLAVLVATIVSIIIGSIWHGPLFGKIFMEAMGMNTWTPEQQTAMKKTMPRAYIGQFIGSFIMFFVLDWYINTSIHTGVFGGVANALGLWLGFVVPLSLSQALWGGKMTLFWINIGSMLLILAAGGAILGAWH